MGLENFFNMANDLMEHENQKKVIYEQGMKKIDIPPITLGQDISELLANSNEQNRLLTEQNRLLQEENERQKQQLIETQKEKEQAQKSARRARVFSWVTFGVATAISIASLLISLFK